MRTVAIGGALLGLWIAGVAGVAGVASAGTIEGSVVLTPSDLTVRAVRPNAYIGQVSGRQDARAEAPADTTYGVAYLVGPPLAQDPVPDPILLDQRGQRFLPRILAVIVGQAVDFRNSDNVFHNVFSYSPPKRFDLGRYPRGKSKRLTFQKPGLVQVFCDIHSDMRADLVVVPSRRFAYIDARGSFRIPDVPSGSHEVVIWLPKRGERTVSVSVPGSGRTTIALGAE